MKARFYTPLDLRHVNDGTATLLARLLYYSAVLGRVIEVPEGFWTDFASVPRLPIVFLLFGGRAQSEAVLHDYLYRIGSGATQAEADRVFLEAMTVEHKPRWIRYTMYWGVRLNGMWAFHRKTITTKGR
jgi:Protein of unknown function (DUF1353)